MSLPYPDASFDAVVSTQVYEYVPDLEEAVSEFGRVMRPGGRGVIVDTDWATPYWSATDTAVRGRIIEAWQSGLDVLGNKGDYFFCSNRYLFEIMK
jgi:arsenite methyltransferase